MAFSTPKGATPWPFRKCGVCYAQATGKHYGALTCDPCKGFFKRSIVSHQGYECKNGNGSCFLHEHRRTAVKCNACRYKRCLRIGMSLSATRMDRVPEAVKQCVLRQAGLVTAGSNDSDQSTWLEDAADGPPSESSPSSSSNVDENVDCKPRPTAPDHRELTPACNSPPVVKGVAGMPRLCAHVAAAGSRLFALDCTSHSCSLAALIEQSISLAALSVTPHGDLLSLYEMDDELVVSCLAVAFCKYVSEHREEIALMEERLAAGRSPADDAMPITPANKVKATEMVLQKVDSLSRDITSFAHACPGFSGLVPEDKQALLEWAFIGVWLISRCLAFCGGDTHLLFSNKTTYCRAWMKEFIYESHIQHMHDYAAKQNAACLSIRELGLMCAINLMSPDGVKLVNPGAVEAIRERLIQVLVYEVNKNRVDSSSMLADIVKLLEGVDAIAKERKHIVSREVGAPSDKTGFESDVNP